ncbi:TatD family hydrolase [Lachnospiraceae bacterium 62-35]
MIFDTHAHYDDKAFDKDRDTILMSLKEHGIEGTVNVSANIASIQSTLNLIKKYPFIYGSLGIHPNETGELDEAKLAWIRETAAASKIVAIGEIGLDYYWDEPEREIQKKWFLQQLDMAKELQMPVIIHSRDAAKDTLDIIKGEKVGEIGGVIHCFSYGVDMAKEYLNMGFFLGIGGVLTFQNARKLKEVVKYAPLEQLVLETDCPYLSPVPYRGKRNSSLNLPYVVKALAEIKQTEEQEIIDITNRNAKRLYRL